MLLRDLDGPGIWKDVVDWMRRTTSQLQPSIAHKLKMG
jgi:hypothetical protein